MTPHKRKRLMEFLRSKAMFFDPNPVVIGGFVVNVSPRYAKPKPAWYPTGPVEVVEMKPYLIPRNDGFGTHQVVFLPKARKVTLNPYRLPYGEVGKSKASPSELIRKDVLRHIRATKVIAGIVTDNAALNPDHHRACIAPNAAH